MSNSAHIANSEEESALDAGINEDDVLELCALVEEFKEASESRATECASLHTQLQRCQKENAALREREQRNTGLIQRMEERYAGIGLYISELCFSKTFHTFYPPIGEMLFWFYYSCVFRMPAYVLPATVPLIHYTDGSIEQLVGELEQMAHLVDEKVISAAGN